MPVLAGVGVLIGVLVTTLFLLPEKPQDRSANPTPQATSEALPAAEFPAIPEVTTATTPQDLVPAGSPSITGLSLPSASGTGSPTATTAVDAATTPPPAPAEVSGEYRVMDTFSDSFIGEVRLTNVASGARHWTVRLRFADNVAGLRVFWVDSAPQATMSRTGDTYVFISTVPLSAGTSVPLRFHLDRTGEDTPPVLCTVNGAKCTDT